MKQNLNFNSVKPLQIKFRKPSSEMRHDNQPNHLSSGGVRIIRQKSSAVLSHMRLTQDIFGIADSQPGGHDPVVDGEAIFWGVQKFLSETEGLFKSVYRLSDCKDKLQKQLP